MGLAEVREVLDGLLVRRWSAKRARALYEKLRIDK